ncbi:protein-export chaperone SecB [Listeria aquatica]|uniref:protein-export chaperone SecB n=1 Tax=Listeria aquatica TaxID=1494960 RepID=UPI003EF3F4FD
MNLTESTFQFKNPRLTNVIFDVNFQFDLENYNQNALTEGKIKISRTEGNFANVVFTIFIGERTNEFPFYIKIDMESDFTWTDSLKDEEVESLLLYNAPSLLLSYIRPIVSALTNSSEFPVYNIPFIDFTSSDVDVEDE